MHVNVDPSPTPRGLPAAWYSYAIVRVVPRVERGERVNVGVILFARSRDYLGARVELDRERLIALAPEADLVAIERRLRVFEAITAGSPEGGPLADLPASERFHWLTAPRSTVIQTSPIHIGATDDPRATLDDLFDAFVRPPRQGMTHDVGDGSPEMETRHTMEYRSPLNPDPADLGRAWREMVEAESAQVERLREWREADHYAPIAHHFADDPRREGDPLLDALRSFSRPDATWLDIGAGGGRYALPLALASERVIAVEPSEGMRGVLQSSMAEHGIHNIDILPLRWPEEAGEVVADFGLVAHVGYDIREINPFLDALERATRERCCVALMDRAPSSGFTRLWEEAHGEPRRQLPGMREFLHLLLARGATPEVRLTRRIPRAIDEADIRQEARRRLWLAEDSEKDRRLQTLLDEAFRSGEDDFQFPAVVALMSWAPNPRP